MALERSAWIWPRNFTPADSLEFDWGTNELSIWGELIGTGNHPAGSIRKFSLKMDTSIRRPSTFRSLFAYLARSHPVEDFTLRFYGGNYAGDIPDGVFQMTLLRRVHLEACGIQIPHRFGGFLKLVKLTLEYVWHNDEGLKNFISLCPMLEDLSIIGYIGQVWDGEPPCFDIAALNLKTFHFFGSFCSLLLSCPNLNEVSLKFDIESLENRRALHDRLAWLDLNVGNSNLARVLHQMPSIQHLRLLNANVFEFLAEGGVPRELPDQLSRLRHLEVVNHEFRDWKKNLELNDWENLELLDWKNSRVIRCLIRSSPHLEFLTINGEEVDFQGLLEN